MITLDRRILSRALLASLLTLPGAAEAGKRLSDKELLTEFSNLLSKRRADDALAEHGDRVKALAQGDFNAANLLAFAYLYSGRPAEAFAVADAQRASLPQSADMLEALLYRRAGAYPLAMEEFNALLAGASVAGKAVIDQKIKSLRSAGLDSWTKESALDLPGGGVLERYKNTAAAPSAGHGILWLSVARQGPVVHAVYELLQVSTREEERVVDYGAELAKLPGARVSGKFVEKRKVTLHKYCVDIKVGEDSQSLRCFEAESQDPDALAKELQENHAPSMTLMTAFREADRAFRKRDAQALGRAAQALADGMVRRLSGVHERMAQVYLGLEAIVPTTPAGAAALRRASEHLKHAKAQWGPTKFITAREGSLGWRLEAYGYAAERIAAALALGADDLETKELKKLLEVTGHDVWEHEPDAGLAPPPGGGLRAELYRNKSKPPADGGIIYNHLELALLEGDRLAQALALSSQELGGKRVYFLDHLVWGRRMTIASYQEKQPAEAEFKASAAAYLASLAGKTP